MWIVHRKEIRKLTFRALVLRRKIKSTIVLFTVPLSLQTIETYVPTEGYSAESNDDVACNLGWWSYQQKA